MTGSKWFSLLSSATCGSPPTPTAITLCTSAPSTPSSHPPYAGIRDIEHLTRTCRSLTVSVYHKFQHHYADECAQLIEHATTDSPRNQFFSSLQLYRFRHQRYAIPSKSIASFISVYTPAITTLHFVLVDCTATYREWDTSFPWIPLPSYYPSTDRYPASLVELHVTFAYTSFPPALLVDAPRGTFFPPPSHLDLPRRCCFHGVQRLIGRDANADFVATEDVPKMVPAAVRDRLEFVRLPRTVDWGQYGCPTITQT
ncbi:hypothetical protein C8R45DRAFT_1102465 [Mycena sanguinolenta]|nr:hypothetical protein C8R45DRAFT_1102465 [Mycena sanguinolenta]